MIESFFTISSANFLGRALTLWNSVRAHYPDSLFTVYLVDDVEILDLDIPDQVNVVNAKYLMIKNFEVMTQKYNITELNTAIKPFAFLHQLQIVNVGNALYLDPDIYVYSRLKEVEWAFESHKDLILTPHIIMPDERGVANNQSFLKFGVYNLGFMGVRKSDEILKVLEWWGAMLLEHCIIDLSNGLFVDQKWADLLPGFIESSLILRHPGYNIAYWNLHERYLQEGKTGLGCNNEELRLVHFSGLEKYSDTISRHAMNLPQDRDIVFMKLKGEYVTQLNIHRDDFFAKIPYSYSWGGEKGINLHTPEPQTITDYFKTNGVAPFPGRISRLQKRSRLLLNAARVFWGSKSRRWFMFMKFLKALLAGDFQKIRAKILFLSASNIVAVEQVKDFARNGRNTKFQINVRRGRIILDVFRFIVRRTPNRTVLARKFLKAVRAREFGKIKSVFKAISSNTNAHHDDSLGMPLEFDRNRILIIDWAIPTPNRDAGSHFQFHLMSLMKDLGREVHFIPANLIPDEEMTLLDLGVKVIAYPDITSIEKWLQKNSRLYGQVWLSRGPVSHPFLKVIRESAPLTTILFNTIDLHFLREERERVILKYADSILSGRDIEQNMISNCDLTIIVSSHELELLQKSFPTSRFFHLPLIYPDRSSPEVKFSDRKDILFVGSFNHAPNWDGLNWFLTSIFPLIQGALPDIRINVVGQNPPPELVAQAEKNAAIVVHGFVDDLSVLYESAKVSVAPLRFGAGAKGKIVQSLSFGVPVISTSIGTEGMGLTVGFDVKETNDPVDFAQHVIQLCINEDEWKFLSLNGWHTFQREFSYTAARQNLVRLFEEVENPGFDENPYLKLSSFTARHAELGKLSPLWTKKNEVEKLLAVHGVDHFRVQGYCSYCKKSESFLTSYMYAGSSFEDGGLIPNWREHLQCEGCRLVTRLRFLWHVLEQEFPVSEFSKVYVMETLTDFYENLKSVFPDIVGSEFVSETSLPGQIYNGIRHEDVERLSFEPCTFDFVISCDVLEHVFDYKAAIQSIFSVLKQGGTVLFTFPFNFDLQSHEIRAEMVAGKRIDLLPPEYHGNPVDPEGGSFCWRYYGWEILEELRGAGFTDVNLFASWSPQFAYLGGPQIVVTATK